MKCADDMTDDSPYRCGVEQLSLWCNQNNLELNMLRNVETSVGAVQHHPHPSPSPQGAGTPSATVTDNSIYTHC